MGDSRINKSKLKTTKMHEADLFSTSGLYNTVRNQLGSIKAKPNIIIFLGYTVKPSMKKQALLNISFL